MVKADLQKGKKWRFGSYSKVCHIFFWGGEGDFVSNLRHLLKRHLSGAVFGRVATRDLKGGQNGPKLCRPLFQLSTFFFLQYLAIFFFFFAL